MNSKMRLSCLFLLCALVAPVTGAELETWLNKENTLWQSSPDQFMQARQSHGFRWVSEKKETARSIHPELSFAGLRVWEALAHFEKDKLKDVTLLLYSRGDAGDLREPQFNELLGKIHEALTKWSGVKPVVLREQERTTTIAISRAAWVKEPHQLSLTWSFTPERTGQYFRPEFVRLVLSPFDPKNAPRAGFRVTPTSQPARLLTIMDIRARVKREPSGDVVVTGVPMVDQGQKGYCAAAVMERVLRYFGREVDQHEMAQMANTATQGGTSLQGMFSALRQMAGELGMETVLHEQFDYADFEKLIADYNRAAQSARLTPISLNPMGPVSLGDVYQAMDTDLLRKARSKREARMQQFKADITKYVGGGCPLVWGVMVGKVEEDPPVRGQGGHLRLIIGINSLKNEILYTDTWGANHERKRMSLADAWAITLSLYTLEPRNMRF